MSTSLFISYSRADVQESDWLGRLRMYLAPFDRQGLVIPWDDGKIAPGTRWQDEIEDALGRAAAAVLIVGPGFLASDFVMGREVPSLLAAARSRGLALFPLIVGYCGYEDTGLSAYQAFNQPDSPLESLSRAEQNQTLNALAIAVVRTLRRPAPQGGTQASVDSLYASVQLIDKLRGDCLVAFDAQCRRRDDLVSSIEERLGIANDLEFEKFFFRHFVHLTEEERFEFDQIRALTEGPLCTGNRKILETIESDNRVLSLFPEMTALRQHLVLWLNKFDRVFAQNRAMCLLYTGVEDGVPFPDTFDEAMESWIAANSPESRRAG